MKIFHPVENFLPTGVWLALVVLGIILSACGSSNDNTPAPLAPTAQPTALIENPPALPTNVAVNVPAPTPAPTPTLAVPVKSQGRVDLALKDLIVTQAVEREPLVVGKLTMVRARIALGGSDSYLAQVNVEFEGKNYSATGAVTPPETAIEVAVDAPSKIAPLTVRAQVQPAGAVIDPNASDNSKTLTLAVIRPGEKITAYFLPVDWTPEQVQRYNFKTAFPEFVQEQGDFLRGTYPIASEDVLLDYTLTPHMLAANEKRLSNEQGDEDAKASYRLYGSISLAGRRLRPDATLIVGVFPPGWFAKHGEPHTLGLSLRDVKGTVTDQYLPGVPLVTSHELAHLFRLYEDYDFSISPPRLFTIIDRAGYWVQKRRVEESTKANLIPTFLSSADDPQRPRWVDSRIYEYLLAKFTIDGKGQASSPLVLAATMARAVETDNSPSDYAAGFQRFDPKDPVYCAVGVTSLRAGQMLEARWFQADQKLKTDKQTTRDGAGWYSFALQTQSRGGLVEGSYRAEIYLDGQLAKTSQFTVKSSR